MSERELVAVSIEPDLLERLTRGAVCVAAVELASNENGTFRLITHASIAEAAVPAPASSPGPRRPNGRPDSDKPTRLRYVRFGTDCKLCGRPIEKGSTDQKWVPATKRVYCGHHTDDEIIRTEARP